MSQADQPPSPDDARAPGDSSQSVLVVAGTVTTKLAGRLRATYDSLPDPVQVIAYGACAISGGPYWDSYSVLPGASQIVPVTLAVPGCPPRPADLASAVAALSGSASPEPDEVNEVHTRRESARPEGEGPS